MQEEVPQEYIQGSISLLSRRLARLSKSVRSLCRKVYTSSVGGREDNQDLFSGYASACFWLSMYGGLIAQICIDKEVSKLSCSFFA